MNKRTLLSNTIRQNGKVSVKIFGLEGKYEDDISRYYNNIILMILFPIQYLLSSTVHGGIYLI